jgi:hypothetical protein
MEAEGRGDQVADAGVSLSGVGGEARDVIVPVSAGRQEIRKDDDGFRALGDAAAEGGGNRRLGQLHVGRFDDREAGCVSEFANDVEEHVVALVAAGAVVDENYAEWLRVCWYLKRPGGHACSIAKSQALGQAVARQH